MRRRLATLAVAALLVVAGCSAGGDDTTTPEYDTDAEPIYETPLDGETVATNHLDVLLERETFTVDRNLTWRDDGDTPRRQRVLVRVDLATGAVYEHRKLGNDTRQTYQFGNGTAYGHWVRDGEPSYSTVERGTTNATEYADGGLSAFVEQFDFDYAGTKTVDGERIYVYHASGPESVDASAFPFLEDSENATLNEAEATLHLREDGTLAEAAYTLDFDTDERVQFVSTTWRIERIGDTDASPPLWIEAARNATE